MRSADHSALAGNGGVTVSLAQSGVARARAPSKRTRPPSRLLFPCYVGGREAMLVDVRKLSDAVATRAGWHAGEITSKIFRHTYCAARLQTLDRGAPVSVYTVAKDLGHGGEAMVRRVYGHLGTVHHRSEFVEYRVEQHAERLRDSLEASGLGPRGAIPGLRSHRA